MDFGGLWADAPDPKMGATAQAGWDKLWYSITHWGSNSPSLGNTQNANGTITHTAVTGTQSTVDPSIPKTGIGQNTFVGDSVAPGSLASDVTDSFSSYVSDAKKNIAADVVDNIFGTSAGEYLVFGVVILGSIILLEGIV